MQKKIKEMEKREDEQVGYGDLTERRNMKGAGWP
jgi:hypothetical protein